MSGEICPQRVQILTFSYAQVREIRTREEHTDAGYGVYTTSESVQTHRVTS